MKRLAKFVRSWLAATTFNAKAGEVKTTASKLSPGSLPTAIATKFALAIADLPLPQPHQEQLRSQLETALQKWRSDPQNHNHLVILADPTEPLEKYQRWVLDQAAWSPVALFADWNQRPSTYTDIADKLAQAIETISADEGQPQVVVMPSLDQCFLRCADGLAAIDYLREAIAGDRRHFWVLSCNQWAWQYLDSVCHIRAYFQQTFTLPMMDGLAVKQWLSPLEATVEHTFATVEQTQTASKAAPTSSEQPQLWASETEEQYFAALATAAGGISQVAAALWLRSLCYQEASATLDGSPQEDEASVILKKLAFTELPTLTADDRYLLFSLTLHRSMSLAHLARTLGDRIGKVTNQTLPLRRQDLIAIAGSNYQLNPAYYLPLRADLRRNNFIVD
ncbi:hypothetical protein [Almyronema epifaneia]|uniref:Uncharacterized protein n=1 Tax=Almyronema epifaneia S1 TaxID=2991925 RepID=A0ABW6IIR5_9CYAN